MPASPEIPRYYEFWMEWLRPLTDKVRTDDLAVAAAKRHGGAVTAAVRLSGSFRPSRVP
jgi:hypothetical protein